MAFGDSFTRIMTVWSKLPVNQRATFVITIPAACLITTLIVWGWSRGQVQVANGWVQHTQTVISESDSLFLNLLDAESAVRGYVLGREAQFLQPYKAAISAIPATQKRLEQLVQDNPKQTARLQEINRLVKQRLQRFQERLISTQQAWNDRATTPQDPSLMTGERLKNEIRAHLKTFQAEEQRLLQERQTRLAQIQGATNSTLIALAVLSLLSSVTALYLFKGLSQELRERERRLRESKFLIQGIVGNVVDGVITLDQQGHIETANASVLSMFGYKTDEILGQSLVRLLYANHTPTNPSIPVDWATLSAQTFRQEIMAYRQDETTFPIELSVSATELEDQLIVIIRDITERKETEARLKTRAEEMLRLNLALARTNQELKHRNRELDQFAYVASHDLKAPLRAIASLSEWIEEDLADQLPEENRQQMVLLRGRVHRMEALINGLLEYSRIGRTQTPIEQVNVYQLVTEVIESLDPPGGFTIEIAPDLPILMTRRVPLSQVFANLINNAIHHHHQTTGYIQIRAKEQDSCYEFSVIDDGPGIDPRYHDKVFTMFQTLTPRDTKESTGIGLAIVKKIVETEGGSITLASELNQGSTFQFTWPKVSNDPPSIRILSDG